MYIVEYFERGKWRELPRTLSASKQSVEDVVEEMNGRADPEVVRLLPVKYKYRFKKVKGNKNEKSSGKICSSIDKPPDI